MRLEPKELLEFQQRTAVRESARSNFLMVDEAYRRWLEDVRVEYKLPTEKFTIDINTGEIICQI